MTLQEEKNELLKKVYKIMHNNVSDNLSERKMKELFFREKFGKNCKKLTEQEYVNHLKEYVNDYEHLEELLKEKENAENN